MAGTARNINRVNAVVGRESLAVEGVRYNIPDPEQQSGPTCWFYAARNMLKSRGLYHGQGWQALEGIRNNLEEYRDRNRAEIFDEVLKGALARPRAIRKQISE